MAVLITIIGFGIMVFLHEFGHFITAKKFGVLVHEFAIGMGPKLFSFGKGETKYSLRIFPIGGFVRLEGEDTYDKNDDNPRSFMNIHPLKRIIILFSGAFMNLVLGWLIFVFINMNMGVVPSIIDTVPDEFASETLFQAGDEILSLNGTRTHTFDDVSLFMSRADGKNIRASVLRNGKKETFTVIPKSTEAGYKLGVTFKTYKSDIPMSLRYAVYDTFYISKAVIFAVSDLITGKASLSTLSGPVEIVSVVGEVAGSNNPYIFISILMLFAMITVNLGVFNLLPFPALDGGSIIFNLYELITRKKIKPEILGYINAAGFALLMLLAAFVTIGDVRDLFR